MMIELQIPIGEYGPLATLAAAANMPLDKYVANECTLQAKEKKLTMVQQSSNEH